MIGRRELTLEDLAVSAGMTARNVRAYRARGLLPPASRDGRRLRYGPEHVARLRLVRSLHRSGLSLKVIGELLERGEAEETLARLSRDRLVASWGRDGLVPLLPDNVEQLQEVAPQLLESLESTGIVVRDGEHRLASAAVLGLVSALLARDVDLVASTRVGLLAGRAAAHVADDLGRLVDELTGHLVGAARQEAVGLAVQLAATAFADVLARRLDLGEVERTAAAVSAPRP